MVNEDINNPQEFAGKLFLLTQKVPEIMNEEEILADLISFHEQQVKLGVEKCERQKKTYEQEKFDLGNKNEELNISLQEKVEEVRKLQTELSREKKTSESLAQEIKEKDKLFEEEKDKLNDLVKQSDDKVKLVVSRSTEIRKGSSKRDIERELNSAKAELAEKTGKYEKQIVKLQGEKTKAEKRVRELETTNKEKERLKSDLAGLQKKLDKEIEEKNLFQEKNRELTKKLRKEGSSSLSSQIGSATNSSCDSLPNLPQKKTFGVSLRKGAKNIFPTKGKKEKVASDTSKGKEKLSLASELDSAFNNSPNEILERQKLSAGSSTFDWGGESEIHVNNSVGSVEQETTKVSDVNDYKRVKEELKITRQELRVLEQENKRQLNSLKEKDEEIQKLKSAKENEKIKKSFSFPDLKSLNNSKSSRLKDELAITKAEKNILEQEVLKKEFKAEQLKEREKERSQKFNEIKNEFEEAAREVKFYSDDLKFLEQEVEKSQVVNAGNLSQIKRISKSRSTPVLNKNQQKTSPNFTWEFLKQDPYSNEGLTSEKEQNTGNKEVNRLKEKDRSILELKKTKDDKQEESDWETASSFSSPTDSIFSHHSNEGSESSFSSSSSTTSRNSLAPISFLKARINRLESEVGLLKEETNKNELEIKEKTEEIGKLKTSLLQCLKKQVIFVSKLEDQKNRLKLLVIVDSNEEEQVKITALLNEIDNSLEKVKTDWEEVRESIRPEEIFPKDWEEACAVFFDFDGIGLEEDDENLSDSEIDSDELKEFTKKLDNLLNVGKSALEDKRIVSQSPIREDVELEKKEQAFDEKTWKAQEAILREQGEKNDDLDELCKSVEEHEQKEFIQEQECEKQRSKIVWEILDLQIQLEEELKDLDEKKQFSEEKIRALEEIVFLLKIVGRKIGLENEEIETKIFQIAKETIQDQELLSQLLTIYNNSFSREKAYNKEKEIIKQIINDLELELAQDSSLNEVIEFIKNLLRSPITNEVNEEIKDELEDLKIQLDEVGEELNLAKKGRDKLQANLDKEINKFGILDKQTTEFLNSLKKAEEEIIELKKISNFQHNIEVN